MNLIDKSKKGNVVATSPAEGKGADSKNVFTVREVPGEDHDLTLARVRMHPIHRASTTMRNFDQKLMDHSVTSITQVLGRHLEDVKAGNLGQAENILITQANTLDVIFNELAAHAGANIRSNVDKAERYLRMALKAQSQCRTTLEALAEIKMPKSATFIRQVNNASQQQVNNGPTVNGTTHSSVPAQGKKNLDDSPNKLLEGNHGKRLDGGTACAPGRTDSHLEAVGAVDRTPNGRGKNAQ
jgi:hypothetical protein